MAGRKFNEYSEYVKVLQESISTYISKMFSSGNLTELQSEQTAGLLCVSNNIERIAERCDEIDKSYENLKSKGYKLSNEAINEVKECMELSGKLFEEAIEAVATGDDKVIDKMTRDKNKIRKSRVFKILKILEIRNSSVHFVRRLSDEYHLLQKQECD